MKNKEAEQKEERRLHSQQIKEEKRKKRKNEGTLERTEVPTLDIKPNILIVCEGEVTEPSYFEQFRLTSATVEIVGKGFNTISLVNEAQRINNISTKEYSEVWCVFDKDDFPDTDFENAIALANGYGFKIAYSNQAFEYWLLLHLNDHQGGAIHRRNYSEMINSGLKQFQLTYGEKDKKIVTEEIFTVFLAKDPKYQGRRRIDLAIQRAERTSNQYTDDIMCSSRCSSTSVHELVKIILKYTD